MSRVSAPALRGTLLGALLRLLNPVMRLLLASPLHWPLSRWFAILEWRGRKSGTSYSTPISYVRDAGAICVTTGDRWWLNLRGGGPVRILLAGRWRTGTAAPEEDVETSVAVHDRLFRQHAWFRVLSGIPAGRGGAADMAAVRQAIEAGRTLVRIELDA